MRRFAIWFGLLLVFACGGVIFFSNLLVYWLGRPDPTDNGPFPILPIHEGGGYVGLAVVIVVGVLLVIRSIRRITMPLGEMMNASEKLAEGEYAVRISVPHGPPEMRILSRTFNEMATRLQDNEQQRRALLADVAHELRTPLTIIQGNIEGMIEGIYPPDENHLRTLLNETHHMSRLLQDLRTLSLAESGMLKLEKEATDVGALIREVSAAFQDQAIQNGISLRVACEAELPTCEIDPVRMREVLANLIVNALRYTPAGGSIEVSCEMDKTDRTQVIISVRDTGAGFPPEALPHVFERFYKSADSGGSGLGLAIAKRLVVLHGGKIVAANNLDGGAMITVTFPETSHPSQ